MEQRIKRDLSLPDNCFKIEAV